MSLDQVSGPVGLSRNLLSIISVIRRDELKTQNDASKTTAMLPQQLNLSANMAWEQRQI